MSKSFLNEAFDRKFGFKDISDEIETEELKRPKRRKYSEAVINDTTPSDGYVYAYCDGCGKKNRVKVSFKDYKSPFDDTEFNCNYCGAHNLLTDPHRYDDDGYVIESAYNYGGAYDIDPSQYFTRDDINEFAEQVVDAINTKSYSKVTLISSYIENNVIEVTVEWDGNEATATQKIDMRKIRRPQQIDKYVKPISDELIRQLKEVGFDTGIHLRGQDYPLDEAFGIDNDDYMDILGGFIDMGYSDEDAERKITNGEYIYYAGVSDDTALGKRYASDAGGIEFTGSNWRYYIDEDKLRNDIPYDIDEFMRDDAEEAVKQAHKGEDESDYDFDKEVEDWIEKHREEYLDDDVETSKEMMTGDELESYFDYEALGRDLRYDGWFYTDNGALYIE